MSTAARTAPEPPRAPGERSRIAAIAWLLRQPRERLAFVGAAVLFWAAFQANPAHLRTAYGDGGGRWEDRVDSFSDRLIVNKLMDDAWGAGAVRTRFLVLTRGYPSGDYSYYPDGVSAYYSHFALQASALSAFRSALGIRSDRSMDRYLRFARAAMAAASALMLALYAARLWREYGAPSGLLAIVLLGGAAGLTLFSRNLYFNLPALLLPFAIATAGYGVLSGRALFLSVAAAAVLNFLCRYEFATTFSVLATVPFFAFRREDALAHKASLALTVFAATLVGFFLALATHVAFAARELGGLAPAARAVLGQAAYRTLTLDQVPRPFSGAFFGALSSWWKLSGLAVPFTVFTFSEGAVLVLFCAAPLLVRPRDRRTWALWGVGLFAYASWYVFAYQHIMWHRQYDWLLFSLGVVPALAALVAQAAARLRGQALVAIACVLVVGAASHAFRMKPAWDPPPRAAPPGHRATLVASGRSDRVWRNGVRRERGQTNQLELAPGAAPIPLAPGTRLFFEGTGPASVTDVAAVPGAGGGTALLVTVDRNLWPERDGAPNPIRVY